MDQELLGPGCRPVCDCCQGQWFAPPSPCLRLQEERSSAGPEASDHWYIQRKGGTIIRVMAR